MNKPLQYLLVGYPFAGKTMLSKELAKRLGFARVNIDEVKFAFGFEGVSDDDVPDEVWQKIFDETDRQLLMHLKEGKNVLNENAWVKKQWRDRLRNLAAKEGFTTKVIYVKTTEEVVRKRWEENKEKNERFDVPENIFEWAINDFEEPTEDEDVIIFDNSEVIEIWISKYFV